ncbi:MAG: hypothetical protein Ta2F_13650 [Termitinemataceae bacterium]|nr:MAG: hypothetical protein Ta2F_13650 [Termitinemataceae bacterium]
MALNEEKAMVSRVKDIGQRDATFLENGSVKVLIDDLGSMSPYFSSVLDKRQTNAHWLPYFRDASGKPYDDAEHGAFWKSQHLYNMAGSFPCTPNFGAGHVVDNFTIPPNGWSASSLWTFIKSGIDPQSGAAWSLTTLDSPEKSMPLSFKKIDAVIPSHPVHYTSLCIKNSGDKEIEINAGFHNTVGSPFLQAGCKISAAADIWTTPAPGGEFDNTTNLALGAEFVAITRAPLNRGGKADLSEVPGPIGFSDLVIGAIPTTDPVGWSSVVNPKLKFAYICFFSGPASNTKDEIGLYFNGFWMQYGGRRYTPWSPWEGGPDMCYCLGMENSVSAYNYGLEYSRRHKTVLDSPTTVAIPGHSQKTFYYGALFAPYEKNILDSGIIGISFEESKLICKSSTESWAYNADPSFKVLKHLPQ